MNPLNPVSLWRLSIRLHTKGIGPLAWIVKAINFQLNHTVLPFEATVGEGVALWHRGLGVVVHPDTVIGNRVQIGHGVTISAGGSLKGSGCGVTIEDDVKIGVGACIIPKHGEKITIGRGAIVGANATVTKSVEPSTVVAGTPAHPIGQR